jgi:PAS domain-containing protein
MDNMCRKPRMLEEVSHFFLSDSCGKACSRKISAAAHEHFTIPAEKAVQDNSVFHESGGKKGVAHDAKAPPAGIIIVDKNKIMRFANPIARRMFGLKAETYLGQLFNFFIEVNEVSEVSIVRENRKPGIASMQIGETEWCNEYVYFAVMRDVTRSWRTKKVMTLSCGGERLFF